MSLWDILTGKKKEPIQPASSLTRPSVNKPEALTEYEQEFLTRQEAAEAKRKEGLYKRNYMPDLYLVLIQDDSFMPALPTTPNREENDLAGRLLCVGLFIEDTLSHNSPDLTGVDKFLLSIQEQMQGLKDRLNGRNKSLLEMGVKFYEKQLRTNGYKRGALLKPPTDSNYTFTGGTT